VREPALWRYVWMKGGGGVGSSEEWWEWAIFDCIRSC